jgi:hypothetical protein
LTPSRHTGIVPKSRSGAIFFSLKVVLWMTGALWRIDLEVKMTTSLKTCSVKPQCSQALQPVMKQGE